MADLPPTPTAEPATAAAPAAAAPAHRTWQGPLAAALLAALLLAPFLNKAYHVDDTVYLRVADEIRERPLFPYNFDYNWDYRQQPMWRITQHPPLNCYILAGVAAVAGPGEIRYHIVYLLLAAGSAALMYSLSRRCCRHPFLATAIAVSCPGFLPSAGNLMADIPLLYFWLLAVYATVRAAEADAPRGLWLAGLAATASAMTKYFGVAVVPLLFVYWLHKTRQWSVHLWGLVLPVVVLFWWGIYAMFQSGIFHPLGAAGYALTAREDYVIHVMNFLHAFSYLGGTLFWPLVLVPLGKHLPPISRIAVYVLVAGAVAREWQRVMPTVAVTYGVMVLAGVMVAAAGIEVWRRHRDAENTLLGLWFFGTLVFAMFFNWTVNVRVMLPAILPGTLLVFRWLESLPHRPSVPRWSAAGLLLTVPVSIVVAVADYDYASAGRTFARTTVRELMDAGETVYFGGHWGFQCYMEQQGARSIDFMMLDPRPGDLVVYPMDNIEILRFGLWYRPLFRRSFANRVPVCTMSVTARAGFYSSFFGPVPFNVTSEPAIVSFAVGRVVERNER